LRIKEQETHLILLEHDNDDDDDDDDENKLMIHEAEDRQEWVGENHGGG
jgi:hypothetical protein